MLTRLRVRGFKNLIDVEVRLGPFTCIAGPNGVGKSNLFDAIHFLALLADEPLVQAATKVRGGDDIAALFTRRGDGRMCFECDVLIPASGTDDYNQPAKASNTFLNYVLELRLHEAAEQGGLSEIRLEREELGYVTKGEARNQLGFPHASVWRDSVVRTENRRTTFITTEPGSGQVAKIVRLQSDRMQDPEKSRRGGGKATDYLADRLPRTVLSSAQNAREARTAALLRNEMRQWRQLQLEPSALRRADDFRDPARIDASGAHVPATLFRLASEPGDADAAYAGISNRIAELVDGVHSVRVDRDEGRKLLRFMLTNATGIELPAASLSDGTMRFVALAVMERDPSALGVLCLEEPENGIHPQRVEAMLRLLSDMSVDSEMAIDEDNPLRQVLTTTHSPVVVGHAADTDLLFARARRHVIDGEPVEGLDFVGLRSSWRHISDGRSVSRGTVERFLAAVLPSPTDAPTRRAAEALGAQIEFWPAKGEWL